MSEQTTEAAQRSAHVTRGPAPEPRDAKCCVCGGPWLKGGASYAVRIGPPLLEVCSATCAEQQPFGTCEAAMPAFEQGLTCDEMSDPIERAVALLCRIGFVLHERAKSGSVYLRFPGRFGQLRVSDHRSKHARRRGVVAGLTLPADGIPKTAGGEARLIAQAVGYFILGSCEPQVEPATARPFADNPAFSALAERVAEGAAG